MLFLQLALTVVLTSLILLANAWVKRNREKYPTIFHYKGVLKALLWIILNSGDF